MAKTTQRKLYRTMQGKMVDIDKLRAANEEVKAVGFYGARSRDVKLCHKIYHIMGEH